MLVLKGFGLAAHPAEPMVVVFVEIMLVKCSVTLYDGTLSAAVLPVGCIVVPADAVDIDLAKDVL